MGSGPGTCWDVAVRTLLPGASGAGQEPVDLAAHYAYPDDLAAPHVRVNFVSSTDGAVTVDGRSGGLGGDADHGCSACSGSWPRSSSSARAPCAPRTTGARASPHVAATTPPPIAVVTGSADLDPRARLFTDTQVRRSCSPGPTRTPIAAPHCVAAGAEVVVLDPLSPAAVVRELGRRGLHRVLCEGGPRLFGDLVAADLVDELCLTVAPVLAAGDAGRIAVGPTGRPAARCGWSAPWKRTANCCCATPERVTPREPGPAARVPPPHDHDDQRRYRGMTIPTSAATTTTTVTSPTTMVGSPARLADDTAQGKTTIAASVVQKIAGIAAREISGVYAMGGGVSRAFGALRERIPGGGIGVTNIAGVQVEVGEKQAAIDLDLVVEYGASIVDLARAVRRNVITAVERMTGLEVIEVNIAVNDIHLPEAEDGSELPVVPVPARVE